MTLDPEISRRIITLLSDRDNPASVSKAIDIILSLCPDRDAEDMIFHLQCVDETGRVVPHEETGLPTTIIKAGDRYNSCMPAPKSSNCVRPRLLLKGDIISLLTRLRFRRNLSMRRNSRGPLAGQYAVE